MALAMAPLLGYWMHMGLKTANASWEWLARRDPLWAILTRADRREQRWDLAEFFATGVAEIDAVFAQLATKGISPVDRSRALDFGCGVGRLTRALAARFDEVHGVDAAPTMVRLAGELHGARPERVQFFLNQVPDLSAFASGAYAFVYSSIVLQHIPSAVAIVYIGEFLRLLKPGGVAVFQVPTLDLTPAALRLLRGAARALVQRLRLPIPALHMEMNIVAEGAIVDLAARRGVELLDAVYTNAHDGDAGGTVGFSTVPPPGRLRSMQFTLRRPA